MHAYTFMSNYESFLSSRCIFMLLFVFIPYADWKSKSDECEKVIDELKEQNGNVTSTLAKLDRQVKSKVGFSNSRSPLSSRFLLCTLSRVMSEVF